MTLTFIEKYYVSSGPDIFESRLNVDTIINLCTKEAQQNRKQITRFSLKKNIL